MADKRKFTVTRTHTETVEVTFDEDDLRTLCPYIDWDAKLSQGGQLECAIHYDDEVQDAIDAVLDEHGSSTDSDSDYAAWEN